MMPSERSTVRGLLANAHVATVVVAMTLAGCATAPSPGSGASPTPTVVNDTSQLGSPIGNQPTISTPAGFAYLLEFGRRTFDPARDYFGSELLAEAPLEDRFQSSDAVLVVDVLEVGDPKLNSPDGSWWSPPHSEDPTLLRPAVGIDVMAQVVGVLKARENSTTFALKPDTPDLSGIGTPHPARLVPSVPTAGEVVTIWVSGGVAKVAVTAEEWRKYLDDWGGSSLQPAHGDEPPPVEEPIPPILELEVGGKPNMDLAEGGRYIVFLRAVEVPQRDGSVRHLWSGDYDTARSQLLVDPQTTAFVEPGNDDVITVQDLASAFGKASLLDPEPVAYKAEELTRLFGVELP